MEPCPHSVFFSQKGTILDEVGESNFSVCFGVTTNRLECFGVGIYFSLHGKVVQRLLHLSPPKPFMAARDIAGEIERIVFGSIHDGGYGLRQDRCLGFMYDGCSKSLKAVDMILKNCPYAVGIPCCSHLFSLFGHQLETEQWNTFSAKLYMALSQSQNVRDCWRQTVGDTPPVMPSHRWGTTHEANTKLALNWAGIVEFITKISAQDAERASSLKSMRRELSEVYQNGVFRGMPKKVLLRVELAMLVEIGEAITTSAHVLEGDQPLVRIDFR